MKKDNLVAKDPCTVVQPTIQLHIGDLLPKLRTSQKNEKLSLIAAEALEKAQNTWCPKIIYRWFPVTELPGEHFCVYDNEDQVQATFYLGSSSRFLRGST